MKWFLAFAAGYAMRRYIEHGDAYFDPPAQQDEKGRLLVGGVPIAAALLTLYVLGKSTNNPSS